MYNVPLPIEGTETKWSEVDGGLLVENATLLAQGTWNGIDYEAEDLAIAANKWRDNTVWNRHYEDKQRDETNRIGYLSNQHFDTDRIVGDVFLSHETPEGQEMITLVKEHKVKGLSVEHVDIQIGNKSTEISFLGIAVVPEPACKICNLSKEAPEMDEKEFNKLKDTVAEQQDIITELKKVDVDAIVKEQSRKDGIKITELEKKITELENTPVVNTQVESDIDDTYAGVTVSSEGINRRV
ncbi:hypothetical protein KAR91_80485 [Candidatus Pacearchaeota archaeon]|nr:hypothetical protein [Candidatus Pacearchaeota archaeon]